MKRATVMSSKVPQIRDEPIWGQPNGLLRMLLAINECNNEWKKDTDFRKFSVNQTQLLFDDCKQSECELYFDIARDYHFIIAQPNHKNNNYKTRFTLNSSHRENATHDWFCFECHTLVDKRRKQYLECNYCWRVFHSKCLQESTTIDSYLCRYCKHLTEDKGFIANQRVDNRRLNVLIGYLLDFIKIKMKDSYEAFTIDYDLVKAMIVFKPMDLNIMRDKAINSGYKSLMEFENDFVILTHNLSITVLDFRAIAEKLADLKLFYNKEMKELRLCVDCYERSNDKQYQESNKDWFCEACEPPHQPLFVKVKHFPYWPAKVLQDFGDGRLDVRFFDKGLKRMEVRASETASIDDQEIINLIKNNIKLIEPMRMLDKYMKNLKMNTRISGPNMTNITGEQTPTQQMSSISSNETPTNNTKNLEDCIEGVVNATCSPNVRISLRTKKNKTNKWSPKARVMVTRNKNSTPNPKQSLGLSQSFNCVKSDSVDKTTVDKIPLFVTEPFQLSLVNEITTSCAIKRKKRGRKPGFSPKLRQDQKIAADNVKAQKKAINERRIVQQTISQSGSNGTEQMEIEESHETAVETNKIIAAKENLVTALNTIAYDLSTGNSLIESMSNSMSSESETSKKSQTGVQIIPELQINVKTNSSSRFNEIIESQNDTKPCTHQKQVVNDWVENQLEESSKEIKSYFDELLKSGESSRIRDKIICIKYYHENQIKVLETKLRQIQDQNKALETRLKQTQEELVNSKKKNWCVVCQKLAQYYCCLRFYCSIDCQSSDWRRGHSKTCLNSVTSNRM